MKEGSQIKKLYVIGNGFDMAHGLETSYWGLRRYIEEQDYEFIRFFEDLYNIQPLDDTEPWYTEKAQERWNKSVNHNLWSTFEDKMGKPNTTSMLEQSISATEGMPTYGIRDHMDIYWEDIFGFVGKLSKYVKEWVEKFDTSKINPIKKSLLNSEEVFLNFNYTDILERVYGISEVMHIHGGVSSITDLEPIMGHCNKQDIQQHRLWAKQAYEEFDEAEASIQDAVANYLDRILKDTKANILMNSGFFENLNSVNHVVIFGWSGGEGDLPYLQEIIRNVDPKTQWTIYWYDDVAYKSLTKLFSGIEEIDKTLLSFKQSDEFWQK